VIERRRRTRREGSRFGFLRRDLVGVSRGTVLSLALAVFGVACLAVGLLK
jgi:hypothetical protein